MKAGAAEQRLELPFGIPMMGYGARAGAARALHDPLHVRALYLWNAAGTPSRPPERPVRAPRASRGRPAESLQIPARSAAPFNRTCTPADRARPASPRARASPDRAPESA